MTQRIHIRGGHLIDAKNHVDKMDDLFIADGKIIAIGSTLNSFTADVVIDAKNKIVCPGLIDLYCQPFQIDPDIFKELTITAARGGITTLCCPPDINPILDNAILIEHVRQLGFIPIAALTQQLEGHLLSNMATMGCPVVSNGRQPILDTQVLRQCYLYAATLNLTMLVQAQDHYLAQNRCVHDGAISARLGLPGIPAVAEAIEISRHLQLVNETQVRTHFTQVSTLSAVQLIRIAQQNGLPVTADVNVHHLFLSELDIENFNTCCHLYPPLRSLHDQQELKDGVRDNIIDAICSGHHVLSNEDKCTPFNNSKPGLSGLETLLPLALRLVHEQQIDLMQLIAKLTANPAQLLHLDKGGLAPGDIADVCVFDLNEMWTVNEQSLSPNNHHTPLLGWKLRGKVKYTLKNGQLMQQS